MAQAMVRKTSSSDLAALRQNARDDFAVVLEKLDTALKGGSKLFPNGIELIKFSVKAGTNIEFSVVLAGKDAPKIDDFSVIPEFSPSSEEE